MNQYKIIDCEQGSEEWFLARCGKITASQFDRVITRTGKKSSQITDVVNICVAEKILGKPQDTFISEAMVRGKMLEDQALEFFNFTNNFSFEKIGFLDSSLGFGCSPDGIDEFKGIGLELKCPLAHTHIEYLTHGKLPDKYYQQVQGSMLVTGFESWVFGSYHPELPCFCIEVKRDEEYIAQLRQYLTEGVAEIEEKTKQLKSMIEAQ